MVSHNSGGIFSTMDDMTAAATVAYVNLAVCWPFAAFSFQYHV